MPDQIEAIREPRGGWCLWDTVEDDLVTTSSGALAIGLTEDEALELVRQLSRNQGGKQKAA